MLVHGLGKFFVVRVVIAAHRVLQLRDVFGRPSVLLTAQAILVDPAHIEHAFVKRVIAVSLRMAADALLGHLLKANAFDGGRGAGKVFGDKLG